MWKCYIPIIGIYFAKKEIYSFNDKFDYHFWPTAFVHALGIVFLILWSIG